MSRQNRDDLQIPGSISLEDAIPRADQTETQRAAFVADLRESRQASRPYLPRSEQPEELESAFEGLSVAEFAPPDRGRGRGGRPLAQPFPVSGPGGSWTHPPASHQGPDPYAAMRMQSGQLPMQQGQMPMHWMPFPPTMGFGMYGEPRQGMYYDSRIHGHPAYPPAFFPPQPMPQPLPGPATGRGFGGNIIPGYYFQPRPQIPSVRQRPARPSRSPQQASEVYDFEVEEAEQHPETCRKTLMLRNIPNKYSIHMLLEMLNNCHGKGPNELVYDFCYLPIDFKNRCNLGYAFVNFVDAESTLQCFRSFHEKRWNDFNSKKVCEVKYGRVQGREALIEHFKNSKFPSNDIDSLPLLFEQKITEDGSKEVTSVPLHSKQPS